MFKVSERYEVYGTSFEYAYIPFTPKSINIVDTFNTQIFTDIPRDDSVICLKDNYIELNSKATQYACTQEEYINADDIR